MPNTDPSNHCHLYGHSYLAGRCTLCSFELIPPANLLESQLTDLLTQHKLSDIINTLSFICSGQADATKAYTDKRRWKNDAWQLGRCWNRLSH